MDDDNNQSISLSKSAIDLGSRTFREVRARGTNNHSYSCALDRKGSYFAWYTVSMLRSYSYTRTRRCSHVAIRNERGSHPLSFFRLAMQKFQSFLETMLPILTFNSQSLPSSPPPWPSHSQAQSCHCWRCRPGWRYHAVHKNVSRSSSSMQ